MRFSHTAKAPVRYHMKMTTLTESFITDESTVLTFLCTTAELCIDNI